MTFAPPFQRVFSPTFNRRAAAAAVSWWLAGGAPTPVAVYQPKGAASLAASYVNLVNPGTYDAAPGTAPAFDAATGWTFLNASAQYLNTGIVPSSTSWSYILRFSNAVKEDYTALGTYTSSSVQIVQIAPYTTSNKRRFYNGRVEGVFDAAGVSDGVMGIAGLAAYYNGAYDGAIPNSSPTATAVELRLGSLAASATQFFSGKIQAIAVYNTTLSAAQVLAVSTAMAAL